MIVDAGAYIGSAAIKLANMFPNAKIACIEPSRSNFDILKRNLGSYKNIEIIHAALAAKSGEMLELRDRGTGHWGFTTISQPEDQRNAVVLEQIQTITMSEIVSTYRHLEVGLVKLDIEGSEKAIFEYCRSDLENIPFIFVELHDRIVCGCTEAFESFSIGRNVVSFGGEKFLSYVENEP